MSSITLTGITKSYDGPPVVVDLDLHVETGKVFGLLGPSGCGKTTTLKMIAGLLEPDSGDIRFDGASVLAVPPERRRIGMVFQQPLLFPHMNVEQNVGFGLRMQGLRPGDALPRVRECLAMVQLERFARRYPHQLSGGQQQRVALARAVVTDPVVLLLDEPLSNLDSRLREQMRRLIRRVQDRLGITTIFVTHDQDEASELSDRMAVMLDGRLAQTGRPIDLFMRPESIAVARFLGSTNLLRGRLSAPGLLETPLGPLAASCTDVAQPGGTVTVSLRWEHLSIGRAADPERLREGPNRFRGVICDVVFGPSRIRYTVEVDGVPLVAVMPTEHEYRRGQAIVVHIDPRRVRVLPGDERADEPAPDDA